MIILIVFLSLFLCSVKAQHILQVFADTPKTVVGEFRLWDLDASAYEGFKADPTITTTIIYELPGEIPGSTQCMTMDTSGKIGFTVCGGANIWSDSGTVITTIDRRNVELEQAPNITLDLTFLAGDDVDDLVRILLRNQSGNDGWNIVFDQGTVSDVFRIQDHNANDAIIIDQTNLNTSFLTFVNTLNSLNIIAGDSVDDDILLRFVSSDGTKGYQFHWAQSADVFKIENLSGTGLLTINNSSLTLESGMDLVFHNDQKVFMEDSASLALTMFHYDSSNNLTIGPTTNAAGNGDIIFYRDGAAVAKFQEDAAVEAFTPAVDLTNRIGIETSLWLRGHFRGIDLGRSVSPKDQGFIRFHTDLASVTSTLIEIFDIDADLVPDLQFLDTNLIPSADGTRSIGLESRRWDGFFDSITVNTCAGCGSGEWTDGGTFLKPTDGVTKAVSIGVDAELAKFVAVGDDTAQITGILREVAAQTADIFQVRQSDDSVSFVVEADGQVGIGIANPTSILHVVYPDGNFRVIDSTHSFFFERSTADSAGGNFTFRKSRSSGPSLANDIISDIQYLAMNSVSAFHQFGIIRAQVVDPTDGLEDGKIRFFVSDGGSIVEKMAIRNSDILFQDDFVLNVDSTYDLFTKAVRPIAVYSDVINGRRIEIGPEVGSGAKEFEFSVTTVNVLRLDNSIGSAMFKLDSRVANDFQFIINTNRTRMFAPDANFTLDLEMFAGDAVDDLVRIRLLTSTGLNGWNIVFDQTGTADVFKIQAHDGVDYLNISQDIGAFSLIGVLNQTHFVSFLSGDTVDDDVVMKFVDSGNAGYHHTWDQSASTYEVRDSVAAEGILLTIAGSGELLPLKDSAGLGNDAFRWNLWANDIEADGTITGTIDVGINWAPDGDGTRQSGTSTNSWSIVHTENFQLEESDDTTLIELNNTTASATQFRLNDPGGTRRMNIGFFGAGDNDVAVSLLGPTSGDNIAITTADVGGVAALQIGGNSVVKGRLGAVANTVCSGIDSTYDTTELNCFTALILTINAWLDRARVTAGHGLIAN